MKQLERMPVKSSTAPHRIGSRKPPRPPARPTMPLTTPRLCGNSSPTYLNVEAMPNAKRDAQREQQHGEEPSALQPRWKLAGPSIGLDRQLGRRIRDQEQHDPRRPQHPPGDARARRSGRRASRRTRAAGPPAARTPIASSPAGLDVETVLLHVVLRHPQRQRGEAAEGERVVLAELPYAPILEHRELLAQRRAAFVARTGVGRARPARRRPRSRAAPRRRPSAPSSSRRLRSAAARRTC